MLAVGALALPVTSAAAATTLGATTSGGVGCGANPVTLLQSISVDDSYDVPSAGVITSWSFQGGASPSPQVKLKVARAAGGNNFVIVGESAPVAPVANTVSTSPTRISVQAGDVIGNFTSTGQDCGINTPGFAVHFVNADVAPGPATTYMTTVMAVQVNASATLEADADADGFGDETQDQCASDATTQGPCPPDTTPPQTSITKSPNNKSDKAKAKYKFTSSEADSTFECKIDKKPYAACKSPKKFGVEKGKHKFAVRAVDVAGNVDPSAAKDRFKVVG